MAIEDDLGAFRLADERLHILGVEDVLYLDVAGTGNVAVPAAAGIPAGARVFSACANVDDGHLPSRFASSS